MVEIPGDQVPDNLVEMINDNLGGYNRTIGLRFVEASLSRLVAEVEITEKLYQPYGLVHGGVYASMIESLCSTGAALNVFGDNRSAVGLENATSFLRAVRSGTLRCTATPLVMGRRSHVWEATVHDDQGRLAATGRVRLMILEPGSEAAGAKVELASSNGEKSDPGEY